MNSLKRFASISLVLFVALIVAACGSTTTTGSTSSSSSPTAAPTPSPTAAQTATVMTATATINGKSVTFLTNSAGMTLYYRTSDTATSVCSGSCAGVWPPLLSSATPTGPSSLPGKLGVLSDTNGSQGTYNGHPLYTYSGDTAAGQTMGEGIAGVWFVAAINISPMSASTSGSYSGY